MKNAIVGQSGGPTAAINATLSGVIRACRKSADIETLYGMKNGVEGLMEERLVKLSEIVSCDADNVTLENTPAAALGSCRKKLPVPDDKIEDSKIFYTKLFDILKKYNIGYFFYIGGNDSMDTIYKLSSYAKLNGSDIKFVGIPKTIDNDLANTDHTPGFGSAAKYIAASMQEIIRDTAVYTVKAVTIVEIMGRDAGWLTACAALPRLTSDVAPDLVYLPEVPFCLDEFVEDVKAKLEEKPNVVVAVSEGIRDKDGNYAGMGAQSGKTDAFGHQYLSGTGKALEQYIGEHVGCKVRSVELNILQRCASHIASECDLNESVMIGSYAVELALSGRTGCMAAYKREDGANYSVSAVAVDIAGVANKVRAVPVEFINERGNNVTDECLNWILPLIQGERQIEYKNGLPVHFVIK